MAAAIEESLETPDPQPLYLSLGSNLGDRKRTLTMAMGLIESAIAPIECASRLYETEPLVPPSNNTERSPNYLNAVVKCLTDLPLEKILERIHGIEFALGRVREARWASRTIDIDILALGSQCLVTQKLVVAHLDLHQRDFVLIPLEEIAPDFVHPVLGLTVGTMLARLKERYVTCKSYPLRDGNPEEQSAAVA